MGTKTGKYLKRKYLTLLILMLISIPVSAKEMLILLSENHAEHNTVAQYIKKNTLLRARIETYENYPYISTNFMDTVQIVVTVGARACETAVIHHKVNVHVICTLIPLQAYKTLINTHQHTINAPQYSAIYLDQPIKRKVALSRIIAPNATSISTLFGQSSVIHREDFERHGEAFGFNTHHSFLHESQNPVQVLTPLIQRSDIFIAIPDNAHFNRSIARWALYITLRNKIPLIGFSENYSEAGAVISIYSTPEQLASETLNKIRTFTQEGYLEKPSYSNQFTIKINRATARTLRLDLPTTEELFLLLQEVGQ